MRKPHFCADCGRPLVGRDYDDQGVPSNCELCSYEPLCLDCKMRDHDHDAVEVA